MVPLASHIDISCSPPWTHCHPTSWQRLSSAARGNACSLGRLLGRPPGLVLTAVSLRAWVSREIQEYLITDDDEEEEEESRAEPGHTQPCKAIKQEGENTGIGL